MNSLIFPKSQSEVNVHLRTSYTTWKMLSTKKIPCSPWGNSEIKSETRLHQWSCRHVDRTGTAQFLVGGWAWMDPACSLCLCSLFPKIKLKLKSHYKESQKQARPSLFVYKWSLTLVSSWPRAVSVQNTDSAEIWQPRHLLSNKITYIAWIRWQRDDS